MSTYKSANIEALAEAMYQRECAYTGADHGGYCVSENIKTLKSFEDEIERLTAEVSNRDEYLRRALHWLDSDLANRYQFPQDIKGWVNSVKVCVVPTSVSPTPKSQRPNWFHGGGKCIKHGAYDCLDCSIDCIKSHADPTNDSGEEHES